MAKGAVFIVEMLRHFSIVAAFLNHWFGAAVFGSANVKHDDRPPESSSYLGFEGYELQAVAITMHVQGVRNPYSEPHKRPCCSALVVGAKCGLFILVGLLS